MLDGVVSFSSRARAPLYHLPLTIGAKRSTDGAPAVRFGREFLMLNNHIYSNNRKRSPFALTVGENDTTNHHNLGWRGAPRCSRSSVLIVRYSGCTEWRSERRGTRIHIHWILKLVIHAKFRSGEKIECVMVESVRASKYESYWRELHSNKKIKQYRRSSTANHRKLWLVWPGAFS